MRGTCILGKINVIVLFLILLLLLSVEKSPRDLRFCVQSPSMKCLSWRSINTKSTNICCLQGGR